MQDFHQMPQPDDLSSREKEDAMGAYLMMFAALGAGLPLPFINVLASLIYYFIHRKRSPFVRFHLIQSMLSQIPLSLLNGFLVIWTIRNFLNNAGFSNVYFGLILMVIFANIIYLGFSIYAAVRARKGLMYYFIFFGPLAYQWAFAKNEEEIKEERNVPPI